MPSFETHVGLTLKWNPDEKRVTLEGENVKLLYPIFGEEPSPVGAKAVYDQVVEHYTERKAERDKGRDEQEGRLLEGKVEFVPRKWRGKP